MTRFYLLSNATRKSTILKNHFTTMIFFTSFLFFITTLFTSHKYVMYCKRWVSWQIYRSKFRDIASYLHVLILWRQRFTLVYVSLGITTRSWPFGPVRFHGCAQMCGSFMFRRPERERDADFIVIQATISQRARCISCIGNVVCTLPNLRMLHLLQFSACKLGVVGYSCIILYLIYN